MNETVLNSESMKIEDLKTKIADAINNSNLSPSVIKLIIDGIAKEITAIASQELVADIKKWKAEQEEEKNEKVIAGIKKMEAERGDAQMAADIQQQARPTTVPVDSKIDLQDK